MSASPVKTSTKPVEMSPSKKQASIERAQELLSSGKRNLLVSNLPSAVSDLAEASSLLAKVHGESSEECGEVYLNYGKALLEVTRLETGVLGQALEGVDLEEVEQMDDSKVEDPEKLSKDEKLEVEEKVAEALEENYEKHDKIAKVHNAEESEVSATEESAVESEDDEVNESKKAKLEIDPIKKPNEKVLADNPEKTEDEEEPGNLQMAWEVLELAKNAFVKMAEKVGGNDKKNAELKVAEAFLLLGEVSLENENYTQAVEDLAGCLKIRESSLPADSRSISETHYQLGVAQALATKYSEAAVSLDKAVKVLQTRIENLGKMEASENISKEIKDLETVVDEIKEKIKDHEDMEKGVHVEKKVAAFPGKTDGVKVSAISIKSAKPAGSTTVGTA